MKADIKVANSTWKLPAIKWKGFIVELLVVFIGVFGAFQLDSFRLNRVELKNRITYFEAFELILKRYLQTTKELKMTIDSVHTTLKENPEKEIDFIHDVDFTNTIFIVESVFSSDRFAGIDSEFMMNLEVGANQIEALENRINILRNTINSSKLNGNVHSEEFREWYGGELDFISNRLSRLMATIEHGALPETQAIIQNLRSR